MLEGTVLKERLETLLDTLERIPLRTRSMESAKEFTLSEAGRERLDSICMILIAVGEAFKQIDRKTGGKYLLRYPEVDWSGVMGVRDILAHGYFDVDVEQVFAICTSDVPALIETIRRMIEDLS